MLERSEEAWQRFIAGDPLSPPNFEMKQNNNTLLERLMRRDRRNNFSVVSSANLTQISIPQPLPSVWPLSERLNATNLYAYSVHSPLHFSVGIANVEAAKILLKHGSTIDEIPETSVETPLHVALCYRSAAMIELLLDRGASFYSRSFAGTSCANLILSESLRHLPERIKLQAAGLVQPDADGRMPVFYVNDSKKLQTCPGLADKMLHFTMFDSHGSSQVHHIWRSRVSQAHTHILNLDIDLSRTDTAFGSALHFCWQDNQVSTLRRLLKRLGPTSSKKLLNFKPSHRDTPFCAAAITGRIRVMELMLEHGADINVIGGYEGTALMIAAAYGRERAVKFLLRLGASTSYLDATTGTTISVFDKAKHFPDIQRWLLVGRWTETKAIGWR